jgi:hypothetical protein
VDSQFTYFKQMLEKMGEDYGGLEMNPDFKRGHVWTIDQKTKFIENVFRGVISSSGFLVQFNCPNFDHIDYKGDLPRGFQCVDGLQRITAVLEFLDGKVFPFWLNVADFDDSSFMIKRNLYRFHLAVHNFQSGHPPPPQR